MVRFYDIDLDTTTSASRSYLNNDTEVKSLWGKCKGTYEDWRQCETMPSVVDFSIYKILRTTGENNLSTKL